MSKNTKKTLYRIAAFVCGLIFILSAIAVVLSLRGCRENFDKFKNTDATDVFPAPTLGADPSDESDPTAAPTDPEPVENPIKFEDLSSVNPDLCAWIIVPGTPIDYPIVRHETEELYYLRRDYKGNPSVSGCIFMQNLNSKDFTDPNTVLYGHYMFDGTFFGSLHNFRDPQFFEENRNIYIYTPGHIFTYEIFAAYEYDNRHILYSFDFSDPQQYTDYLSACLDPQTMNRNIRQGIELTAQDRIITLSTCVQNSDKSKRYLVQGVLRNDQPTK